MLKKVLAVIGFVALIAGTVAGVLYFLKLRREDEERDEFDFDNYDFDDCCCDDCDCPEGCDEEACADEKKSEDSDK